MFSRKLFSASRKRRTAESRPSESSTAGRTSPTESRPAFDSGTTTVTTPSQSTSSATSKPLSTSSRLPLSVRSVQSATPPPTREGDALGLTLLYAPEGPPAADIIFIHGLGGSSRLTWCKNRDLELFWPQKWLPTDRGVTNARVFTFGYNAHFRSSIQNKSVSITDFAKGLLYDMRYGGNADGSNFQLGKVPIVFVAHSMGGLIFKKAYLDGQLDKNFEPIVKAIDAVIFLSTPHRGSDHALLLNRILSVSFMSTPKQYIAELHEQGPFLQTVNEQFRKIAPRLKIFSFYETLRTAVGLGSVMILPDDSSRLDYPGEISRPLNADHHSVCKFENPKDPNYLVVLGALQSLLSSYSAADSASTKEELRKLQQYLSVSEPHDADLTTFWNRRSQETCTWILHHDSFSSWITPSSTSKLLWIHAPPGRGKSVLSSFIIQHLRQQSAIVQYFFFRAGDTSKRSVGSLLRSLAYQLACELPEFRHSLLKVADSGYAIKDSDWLSAWKKLFSSFMSNTEGCPSLYWILDGLDESNSQQELTGILAEISDTVVPLRVLATSRWSPTLSSAFEKLGTRSSVSILGMDEGDADMRIYIDCQLRDLDWDQSIKDETICKILEKANDSFLWVAFVLDEVRESHSENDISERISELPSGMDSLYRNMENTISSIRRPTDRNLCRTMLIWATYARHAIDLEELSQVLEPGVGRLLNLTRTINTLCGHFVVVTSTGRVELVHHTARDYLSTKSTLPFSFASSDAHNDIFRACILSLMDKSLRSRLDKDSLAALHYRATSWAYHLEATGDNVIADSQLDLLLQFFGQSSVLTWIRLLASLERLSVLLEVPQQLQSFVKRKREAEGACGPVHRRFKELELLEVWSRDLLKVMAKFGSTLSIDPDSIYTSVVPFCPASSAIYKSFGFGSGQSPVPFNVKGVSDEWDDCLARVSVGPEHLASLLCASSSHLAIVNSAGAITICDSSTFHQIRVLEHNEVVSSICFTDRGDRLATYGSRTTKVWNPRSGETLRIIPNLAGTRALCLKFIDNDSSLIMGADRACILRISLAEDAPLWTLIDQRLLKDDGSLEGTFLNWPTSLSISPDGTKIAACYRRYPLTVWDVASASVLKRISRPYRADLPTQPVAFALQMSWHPNSDELIGIFMDGSIFKSSISTPNYQEIPPNQIPSNIVCSPDGFVYAVCVVLGTVKIYDYETSTLMYQLSSEDCIESLCFSRDCRRFYDIRGSYCNIWEPSVLLRTSAGENDASVGQAAPESVDQSNIPFESVPESSVTIAIIAPMPRGSITGLGYEKGLVELLDCTSSQRFKIDQVPSMLSIEHLVWNSTCTHFCYAEISGRLTLVEVGSSKSEPKHKRVARFKPATDDGGGIRQLLFIPNSESLLVAYTHSAQIWSTNPLALRTKQSFEGPPVRWLPHPLSSDYLVSVRPGTLKIHDARDLAVTTTQEWADQQPQHTVPRSDSQLQVSTSRHRASNASIASGHAIIDEEVEDILATYTKAHILVKVSRRTRARQLRPRFVILDTAALSLPSTTTAGPKRVAPVAIPAEILSQLATAVSILKNERLVFVDRWFGVCSWRLGRDPDSIKRHFFIPRDWLSAQSLDLLRITESGTILCPRRGGIVVIENTIGAEW